MTNEEIRTVVIAYGKKRAVEMVMEHVRSQLSLLGKEDKTMAALAEYWDEVASYTGDAGRLSCATVSSAITENDPIHYEDVYDELEKLLGDY